MATETLTCQHGKGHKFEREVQRGRKPVYCPDHMTEHSGDKPEKKDDSVKHTTAKFVGFVKENGKWFAISKSPNVMPKVGSIKATIPLRDGKTGTATLIGYDGKRFYEASEQSSIDSGDYHFYICQPKNSGNEQKQENGNGKRQYQRRNSEAPQTRTPNSISVEAVQAILAMGGSGMTAEAITTAINSLRAL